MYPFHKFSLLILLFIAPVMAVAQIDTCPTIVQSALAATETACSSIGRNQACYGNVTLSAEPQANVTNLQFNSPGDLVDIAKVKSLTLSPLSQPDDSWGVAMMKVQANLPDTLPGQNVTFLLFGGVEIQNAVASNVDVEHTEPGDSPATETPSPTPMQVFYFRSGLHDAPCEEAPDSGILVQTPKDSERIELTVNGARISLGSTAYLQAQPNGEMTVSVIEGAAVVEVQDEAVYTPAGTRVRIPLDSSGNAASTPVGPEAYNSTGLAALPLSPLERDITVATPLTEEQLNELLSGQIPIAGMWEWHNTDGTSTPSRSTNPITVEEDGSAFTWGKAVYTLVEPGTYRSIRDDENGYHYEATMYVITPTQMDFENHITRSSGVGNATIVHAKLVLLETANP